LALKERKEPRDEKRASRRPTRLDTYVADSAGPWKRKAETTEMNSRSSRTRPTSRTKTKPWSTDKCLAVVKRP
jgi:hypothetical protein